MALLFRPFFPVDQTHWLPVLSEEFAHDDLRIWPDVGDVKDIQYYMGWRIFDGDRSAYPNLKAFLSFSAGIERIITHPEFPENAKLIRMMDPGLTASLAEYIVSFVLRFHREHDLMDQKMKGKWGTDVPKNASDRTVGFLGLGNIGQAAAHKLMPFGFNIQSWSKSPKDIEGIKSFVGNNELEQFLKNTDILVCILPLTEQTENILDADLFSKLPKGACIINVARGKHVVDEDLINAIKSGHIRAAALDVFRKEPLPLDHGFYNVPEIILSPHISGVTVPSTAVKVLRQSITDLENGINPDGFVNFENGY